MSHIRGRIAVDVQFTDSTTSAGVQSLKTLTLQDATEYTTGKVAIVTGTCGTTPVIVGFSPTTYKDASGSVVSFASVKRLSFTAAGFPALLSADYLTLESVGNACVTDLASFNDSIAVLTTAGTASYTLVIYGT